MSLSAEGVVCGKLSTPQTCSSMGRCGADCDLTVANVVVVEVLMLWFGRVNSQLFFCTYSYCSLRATPFF